MRKALVFTLLFLSHLAYSQPGVSPKAEKDGKTYYVHTVEQGHTLWGLQQMYGVPADDILRANPELSAGLKAGQKILVPVREEQVPEELTDYEVEKGETLYGISKKFNTTVDHLVELNPELSGGLKKGQVIKVPGKGDLVQKGDEMTNAVEPLPNPFVVDTVKKGTVIEKRTLTFNDSIVQHTVLSHETMYSISKRYMVSIDEIMRVNGLNSAKIKAGQILTIPLKRERIETVEIRKVMKDDGVLQIKKDFEKKERYKIAVLAPFFLDYGAGYSEYVSNLATQFYMGVDLAVDSLKAKGLKADVFVYDTRNDSATVVDLLHGKGLQHFDLIIGPFFEKSQKIVADFCKQHGIRMVCPVITNASVLMNNPYVYASVPSNITLISGAANYILENNKGANVLLIRPLKDSDKPLYDAFLKTFNEAAVTGGRPKLTETTIDEMKLFIRRGMENIFIVPANDKSTAMKFMNSLNRSAFRSGSDDIIVYGTAEWVNFKDVNNLYKNKYNFHFAGPNFLDYYSEEIVEMNKQHRAVYKTDLSRMATQGYDVMTYFCSDFFLDDKHPFLLMNKFEMHQLSESDGYENSHVFIIEQEEYELVHLDETRSK